MFSDHALVNYSITTRRRIKWIIGLEYHHIGTAETIRAGILSWLDSDPRFVTEIHEVPNIVHIEGFNDSSIDMLVYCFTETTRWYDWLSAKEDLALAIKQIVEEVGASAFPSRSIYVEQGRVE